MRRRPRTVSMGSLLTGVAVVAVVAGVAWWASGPLIAQPPAHEGPERAATSPASVSLPGRPPDAFPLRVEYVYDGDTLRAEPISRDTPFPRGVAVRVRLIGIDAPEGAPTAECGADEAHDRLRALLPEGSTVWAAADRDLRDRYDRALLYLWTDDDVFVNHALVSAGDAVAIRVGRNDTHFALLSRAAAVAEAEKRGQWGVC
ncbi:thermonuclease family protein [Microbacterium sp.]|uniref:thermonuclease family protein n=1 Tax=Microbacterium sp. TaxID=51671 RepID=UPI0039E6716A